MRTVSHGFGGDGIAQPEGFPDSVNAQSLSLCFVEVDQFPKTLLFVSVFFYSVSY